MAEAGGLEVAVAIEGTVASVTVSGELDVATAPKLRAALAPLGRAPGDVVVVDVGGLAFADASALGVLVSVHTRVAETGARLVIRNPSPLLERMLDITQVAGVLSIDRGNAL